VADVTRFNIAINTYGESQWEWPCIKLNHGCQPDVHTYTSPCVLTEISSASHAVSGAYYTGGWKQPSRRPSVRVDLRDWWIGYYRSDDHHHVCILPCILIRWRRRGR
jgi:hypothetical protein